MNQSIKLQIQEGLDLINKENWNEALIYFKRQRNQSSYRAYSYYLESFALEEINLLDEAQKSVQNALKIDPQVKFNIQPFLISDNSPMANIIRCSYLISLEKYPDAMTICDQILSSKPQFIPALRQRAYILLQQDKFIEPSQEYDKILKIKNDYLSAYLGKSKILERFINYQEALKFLTIAQQFHPFQKCIYFLKSEILEKNSQFQESLLNYDLLLQIDKADPQIYIERGNCLISNKEFETAIWCFNKALTLATDQIYDISIRKGQALVKLKKYQEALEQFDFCINHNPENHEGYFQKSIVLYDMKDFQTALIFCNKVIQMRQDIKDIYLLKGNIIFKLFYSRDAIEYYDYIIDNFKNNIDAYILKCLNLFKFLDKALELLEQEEETKLLLPILKQQIKLNIDKIPKFPFELIQYTICLLLIKPQDEVLLEDVIKIIKKHEQVFNINDEEEELILHDKNERFNIALIVNNNYYYLRGQKLFGQKNYEKSYKFFDLAIKQDEDNFRLRFQKYVLLNQQGLTEEAEQYLGELFKIITQDIELIMLFINFLYSYEIYREALIVIKKADQLIPQNFYIQQWMYFLENIQT